MVVVGFPWAIVIGVESLLTTALVDGIMHAIMLGRAELLAKGSFVKKRGKRMGSVSLPSRVAVFFLADW